VLVPAAPLFEQPRRPPPSGPASTPRNLPFRHQWTLRRPSRCKMNGQGKSRKPSWTIEIIPRDAQGVAFYLEKYTPFRLLALQESPSCKPKPSSIRDCECSSRCWPICSFQFNARPRGGVHGRRLDSQSNEAHRHYIRGCGVGHS
jgi:hypothetical protein